MLYEGEERFQEGMLLRRELGISHVLARKKKKREKGNGTSRNLQECGGGWRLGATEGTNGSFAWVEERTGGQPTLENC